MHFYTLLTLAISTAGLASAQTAEERQAITSTITKTTTVVQTSTSYTSTKSCIATARPLAIDIHRALTPPDNRDLVWADPNAKSIGAARLLERGSGFVVKQEDTFFTLVGNGHGWKVVNCSQEWGVDVFESRACVPYDVALYYPAPAPVDLIDGGIGSIGTIERLAYPGRSPWSLFELHDLRITPTPPGNIERGELLVAEILGWNEKGEFVGRRVQDLERGYIWYKITMVPPLERIVKFQVRVYRAGTTSRVPEYLGVMLNDLNITDYSFDPKDCAYTPTDATDSPIRTINVRDIGTDPSNTSTVLGASFSNSVLHLIATTQLFEPLSLSFYIDGSSLPDQVTTDSIVFYVETSDTCNSTMYRDVRSFTMGNGIKKLFLQPDQNWRINKVYEMKVWLLPEAVKWRLEEIEVKTWDELPGCYWCGLGRGEEGCEWPEVKRGMPFVFEWENENGAQVGGV